MNTTNKYSVRISVKNGSSFSITSGLNAIGFPTLEDAEKYIATHNYDKNFERWVIYDENNKWCGGDEDPAIVSIDGI